MLAPRPPVAAYIGLGANLGHAPTTLVWAIEHLQACPDIHVVARSSLYRTAPIDSSGPDYSNAVLKIQTSLTAPALLQCLNRIEADAGRTRPYRNAPRTLDLDILLYGDARVDSATLTIPHPRMYQRAFVLLPLAEIARERVGAERLQQVADQAIERLAWP